MNKKISFELVVAKLARFLDSLAMLIFSGLILLLIVHILSRAFFRAPLPGVYDYVSLFTVVVVSCALARCTYEKGHIAIEFILERFPPAFQKYVDIIISSFVLILFISFAYQLLRYGYSMYIIREVSLTVSIPLYPFVYTLASGLSLMSLVLVVQLIERIKRGV